MVFCPKQVCDLFEIGYHSHNMYNNDVCKGRIITVIYIDL